MLEGLKELKFYKRGHELVAYDGDQFYKVEQTIYVDSKTHLQTGGFRFVLIDKYDTIETSNKT